MVCLQGHALVYFVPANEMSWQGSAKMAWMDSGVFPQAKVKQGKLSDGIRHFNSSNSDIIFFGEL